MNKWFGSALFMSALGLFLIVGCDNATNATNVAPDVSGNEVENIDGMVAGEPQPYVNPNPRTLSAEEQRFVGTWVAVGEVNENHPNQEMAAQLLEEQRDALLILNDDGGYELKINMPVAGQWGIVDGALLLYPAMFGSQTFDQLREEADNPDSKTPPPVSVVIRADGKELFLDRHDTTILPTKYVFTRQE
ncbi:MAG: hypothetical protein ACK4P3_07000 [Fimbriimonadaceae bacterium]